MPAIADMDNLRLAFWKASKGKRYAANVLTYQDDLNNQLQKLQSAILSGQVEVGDYQYFYVYEPKKLEICASAFREQVLHHALMNVCHQQFERKQIYDSYASRKGKGTYAALDRAKKYSRRYGWYLKLDIKKFFASIHHVVLKKQLSRLFKEQSLLAIFSQIIDSFSKSEKRGLPIGNLTSQYFANQYLVGLDHYIKEQLRMKAYLRYMDDMFLWADEKSRLLAAKTAIEDYIIHQLKLRLNPVQLNKMARGLPMLGYQVFPYQLRLLQKSKRRFIRKLTQLHEKVDDGLWDEQTAEAHALPLLAFTEHADAVGFRKKVMMRFKGQIP